VYTIPAGNTFCIPDGWTLTVHPTSNEEFVMLTRFTRFRRWTIAQGIAFAKYKEYFFDMALPPHVDDPATHAAQQLQAANHTEWIGVSRAWRRIFRPHLFRSVHPRGAERDYLLPRPRRDWSLRALGRVNTLHFPEYSTEEIALYASGPF
jgi:hypothetical protein